MPKQPYTGFSNRVNDGPSPEKLRLDLIAARAEITRLRKLAEAVCALYGGAGAAEAVAELGRYIEYPGY